MFKDVARNLKWHIRRLLFGLNKEKVRSWCKLLLCARSDSDEVVTIIINFVIKDSLSFDKADGNLNALGIQTESTVRRLFSQIDDQRTCSISSFSLVNMALGFPVWFYAFYPDVMKWFHDQQSVLIKKGASLDELSEASARMFGVNFEEMKEEEVGLYINLQNKQYRPYGLRCLADNYMRGCGSPFETVS